MLITCITIIHLDFILKFSHHGCFEWLQLVKATDPVASSHRQPGRTSHVPSLVVEGQPGTGQSLAKTACRQTLCPLCCCLHAHPILGRRKGSLCDWQQESHESTGRRPKQKADFLCLNLLQQEVQKGLWKWFIMGGMLKWNPSGLRCFRWEEVDIFFNLFAQVAGGMPNPGENRDLFYRSLELPWWALMWLSDFSTFCWNSP